MVESPVKPLFYLFGGHIEVSGADGPASRTSDGVRFVFVGPEGVAIDAERRDEPVPDGLPSMQLWTEIEVAAKLRAQPVMTVFAHYRETGQLGQIELVRLDSDTHFLVAGRLV